MLLEVVPLPDHANEQLTRHPDIDPSEIGVRVRNGEAEAAVARAAVWRQPGVGERAEPKLGSESNFIV